MSYDKINFEDNITPLDAENFNHMEDGIAANADDIDTLSADLTDMNLVGKYYTSIDDFISDALQTTYRPIVFSCNSTVSGILSGGVSTAVAFGIAIRNTPTLERIAYSLFFGNSNILCGQMVDGEVTGVYRFTGTVV